MIPDRIGFPQNLKGEGAFERFRNIIQARNRFPLIVREEIDSSVEYFLSDIMSNVVLSDINIDALMNDTGKDENGNNYDDDDDDDDDDQTMDETTREMDQIYALIERWWDLSDIDREILQETVSSMTQVVLHRVLDAVNYFYFKTHPDPRQETEAELEAVVRFFPHVVDMVVEGECGGPLLYLVKDVRSITFIPIMLQLITELLVLSDPRNGSGLLRLDTQGKNVLHYLCTHEPVVWKVPAASWYGSGAEHDMDEEDSDEEDSDEEDSDEEELAKDPSSVEDLSRLVPERKFEVMNRLAQMQMFVPQDVETYDLVNVVCASLPFCQRRFEFLVAMNPKGLTNERKGSFPLHAAAARQPFDVFRFVLKTTLDHFPRALGFFFHTTRDPNAWFRDNGYTPYAIACKAYGIGPVNELLDDILKRTSAYHYAEWLVSLASNPRIDVNGIFCLLRRHPSLLEC